MTGVRSAEIRGTRPSPTRRAFLAAAGALLAAGPALAQQPAAAPAAPRVKGPRVFLDYDQAELDAAYDQSVWAPNQRQITGRYATNSELARVRLGPPRRLAYGPTAIEKLDVYSPKRPNAPIMVFIHGGAWRAGRAADYAFPAETFVRAGAHFVVLDFALVQDVGGSLLPMADQVRRAVAWCYRNAASFGGDPNRLYVSGHSSGGHLAGVVAVTDWVRDFGLPADAVKGTMCVSGIYDLAPVRLSARSSYVKFTDEMVQALSTIRYIDRIKAPMLIAHGTLETPEFQRQNREFAEALRAAGRPSLLVVAQGYNHFEILETLANPYGLLGRPALELMRIQPG
jgi:arylformamidase